MRTRVCVLSTQNITKTEIQSRLPLLPMATHDDVYHSRQTYQSQVSKHGLLNKIVSCIEPIQWIILDPIIGAPRSISISMCISS